MIYGIFGHHTGGTSAVAGILAIHGLPFYGEPRTLDDTELRHALMKKRERDLFKERGNNWFFKHPLILDNCLDLINRFKVKPIYVFRDPAAIWLNSGKTPTREKIVQSCIFYTQMSEMPEGLYVSYEKLMTDKENQVKRICEYIGKEYNPKSLDWLTQGYKPIADYLN